MTTQRRAISSDTAPPAVGPYSQAVRASGLVFASGQLGLATDGTALVEGGVAIQARQALANLEAVAHAAGLTLNDAVKVTIFLTDMADFAEVNGIYAEFFSDDEPPARSTVEVAGLPLGGLIEIDAIFAG